MRTPIEEQETTIQMDRNSDVATVYTSDYTYMTKLDKHVEGNPDEWRLVGISRLGGDIVGKTYECPKRLISFRSKTMTREREYTEEERRAIGERLKNAKKKGSGK